MFNYGTVALDSTMSYSNRATCLIKHAATDRLPEHQSHKLTFELLIKMDDMLPSTYSWEDYMKAATRNAVEAETTTVIVFAYWALYLDMVHSARPNSRDKLVVRKRNGVYVGTYAIVDMSGLYGYGQNEKVQVHFPKGTSHFFCEVFSVKATLNRTGESVVSPTGELTDSRCTEEYLPLIQEDAGGTVDPTGEHLSMIGEEVDNAAVLASEPQISILGISQVAAWVAKYNTDANVIVADHDDPAVQLYAPDPPLYSRLFMFLSMHYNTSSLKPKSDSRLTQTRGERSLVSFPSHHSAIEGEMREVD